VAAALSVDPARWQEQFDELMGRIAGRFARVEPRRRARALVLGLLSGLRRKNCWTIAEQAGATVPLAPVNAGLRSSGSPVTGLADPGQAGSLGEQSGPAGPGPSGGNNAHDSAGSGTAPAPGDTTAADPTTGSGTTLEGSAAPTPTPGGAATGPAQAASSAAATAPAASATTSKPAPTASKSGTCLNLGPLGVCL